VTKPTKEVRVLAFDFGASSGRAILGLFRDGKICLQEVHRFANEPVSVGGTVYWDVLRQFHEIRQGLTLAQQAGGFSSVGIDTWGVDFGLLGQGDALLENPVHYRDMRTKGLVEESFQTLSREKQYGITGIQFMELNTLYQLLALKKYRPHILAQAQTLLFMPDLFAFMLTGKKTTEFSIATTSQLVDINRGDWSRELLEAFGLPKRLLCDIVPSGTVLGDILPDICADSGIPAPVPVISVCGHDTQSAITAVPCSQEDFVFLSSGTWSLFGTELQTPIVNETSLALNITNEGGCGGATGFLKNIIGLWLIQESRRQFAREGMDYSYAELEALALEAEPLSRFIDPDAPEFVPHGNIPQRVRDFCARTGQNVPQSVGEVMRCIYESLAMKYRYTFESLCRCTGKDYPAIHVIGGGVKDTFLCQLTANACERQVFAGPIEATVLGNIAVQLLSMGVLPDIAAARACVANSVSPVVYNPQDTVQWENAYGRFLGCLES